MTQGNIYFDYNATTPVDSQVKKQVPQWLELWGNPSSIHRHGRGPKKLMRDSRRQLADFLGCHPLELVFTSGGSEANNLALQGCLRALRKKSPERKKVLLGAIEHPSVLQQQAHLEAWGFEVERIPVNESGVYDLELYQSLVTHEVAMVSVMLANNEVGVIAPISEMAQWAHEKGAYFHSDLVQALGKLPFSLQELGVDLASFSSHKIYALKGTGLLYVKKGTPLEALTLGGAQERKRRAGTENLMAIASFNLMAQSLCPQKFVEQLTPLRDEMEKELKSRIPDLKILCAQSPRLANTSTFCIEGLSGESLLMNLDIRGFSVGTGAACSSGNPEPSPVLLALGLKRHQAQSSLRISLGWPTTRDQIIQFVETLEQIVSHMRDLNSEEALHV